MSSRVAFGRSSFSTFMNHARRYTDKELAARQVHCKYAPSMCAAGVQVRCSMCRGAYDQRQSDPKSSPSQESRLRFFGRNSFPSSCDSALHIPTKSAVNLSPMTKFPNTTRSKCQKELTNSLLINSADPTSRTPAMAQSTTAYTSSQPSAWHRLATSLTDKNVSEQYGFSPHSHAQRV